VLCFSKVPQKNPEASVKDTVEKILMDQNNFSSTIEGILLGIIIEELHTVIIIVGELLLVLNVCDKNVPSKNFFCGPSNIFNNKIIIRDLHNIEELPSKKYNFSPRFVPKIIARKSLEKNILVCMCRNRNYHKIIVHVVPGKLI
jgi:hypothetical protein